MNDKLMPRIIKNIMLSLFLLLNYKIDNILSGALSEPDNAKNIMM